MTETTGPTPYEQLADAAARAIEADPNAMRWSLSPLRAALERCRAEGPGPRILYAGPWSAAMTRARESFIEQMSPMIRPKSKLDDMAAALSDGMRAAVTMLGQMHLVELRQDPPPAADDTGEEGGAP